MCQTIVILLLLALVALVAYVAYASATISSGFFVKATCRLGSPSSLLLTFDDGPDPRYTPALLDLLARLNVRAVFFVIGQKAQAHPELIRRMVAEGHLVGNHTFVHNPFYAFRSARSIARELRATDDVLRSLGVEPKLFRPPLGITNRAIAKAAALMNYRTVGWSIRSFDTRRSDTPERILKRVVSRISGGDIVLLHDRMPDVCRLVGQIVIFARERHGIEHFDHRSL